MYLKSILNYNTLVEIHFGNCDMVLEGCCHYAVVWDLRKVAVTCETWEESAPSTRAACLGRPPSFGGRSASVKAVLGHPLVFLAWRFFFIKFLDFSCLILEIDVYYLFPIPCKQKMLIIHIVVQAFNQRLHHWKWKDTTYSYWAFCDPGHILSMLIFMSAQVKERKRARTS